MALTLLSWILESRSLFSIITFIYPKFLSLKTLPLDFLEDTKCIILDIKNQVSPTWQQYPRVHKEIPWITQLKNKFTWAPPENVPACPTPPTGPPPCPKEKRLLSPGDSSEVEASPSAVWFKGEDWEEWPCFCWSCCWYFWNLHEKINQYLDFQVRHSALPIQSVPILGLKGHCGD